MSRTGGAGCEGGGGSGHGFLVADRRMLRRRTVGPTGMAEDVEPRSHAQDPTSARVELLVAADFLDLFAVEERRTGLHGTFTVECGALHLAFAWRGPEGARITVVDVTGLGTAVVTTDGFSWNIPLGPGAGHHEAAARVAQGLVAAAEEFRHHLPERLDRPAAACLTPAPPTPRTHRSPSRRPAGIHTPAEPASHPRRRTARSLRHRRR